MFGVMYSWKKNVNLNRKYGSFLYEGFRRYRDRINIKMHITIQNYTCCIIGLMYYLRVRKALRVTLFNEFGVMNTDSIDFTN